MEQLGRPQWDPRRRLWMVPTDVVCPRFRPAGQSCGSLVGLTATRTGSPTRYACNRCQRLWSPRDVSALLLARRHAQDSAVTPDDAHQLPLFDGTGA